ncbi:hypothetical protein A2U01_0048416, partial [Trifolium medium]|nr:hypothetical protein [Trifolium medium]
RGGYSNISLPLWFGYHNVWDMFSSKQLVAEGQWEGLFALSFTRMQYGWVLIENYFSN